MFSFAEAAAGAPQKRSWWGVEGLAVNGGGYHPSTDQLANACRDVVSARWRLDDESVTPVESVESEASGAGAPKAAEGTER